MGNVNDFVQRQVDEIKKRTQIPQKRQALSTRSSVQTPQTPTSEISPPFQVPQSPVSPESPQTFQTLQKTQTSTNQKTQTSTNQKSPSVTALLIVDVQYDFIDGSLALKNCPSQHQGDEVIPVINKLLHDIHFDIIVYTQDWHTPDHISFHDNLSLRKHLLAPDSKSVEELNVFDTAVFLIDDEKKKGKLRVEQILWPRHCVQHSHGAELHRDLEIYKANETQKVVHLFKGDNSEIDSYSAFWDNQKIRETTLNATLKERNITHVFIVGIATDVCVYATALHAVEYGYKTYIVEDACRGVDLTNIHLRLKELISRKCSVIEAKDIKNLL